MPNILVHGHMRYDTSEEDKLKEHIQQVELELSKLRNDLEILQLRENDLENNNKILKRAVRHMKKEDNKNVNNNYALHIKNMTQDEIESDIRKQLSQMMRVAKQKYSNIDIESILQNNDLMTGK